MNHFARYVIAGAIACSPAMETAAQQTPDIFKEPTQQSVPEEPTMLHAIQLVQQVEVYARAIAALTEVPAVEIVNFGDLTGEEASQHMTDESVNEVVLRNRDGIDLLHNALSGNSAVAEALAATDVDPSSVLAAEVRPDLTLRVYVRDRRRALGRVPDR